MLQEGEPAPEFELLDHQGEPVRLADFDGRQVVLYFYPKADTPGCTTEACSFRDSWHRFEDLDVAVVGVSTDSPAELQSFREKYSLPFRLLSDESGEVARAYDSFTVTKIDSEQHDIAERNTFVIDEDGRINRIYEGVSPDTHVDEITRYLSDSETA